MDEEKITVTKDFITSNNRIADLAEASVQSISNLKSVVDKIDANVGINSNQLSEIKDILNEIKSNTVIINGNINNLTDYNIRLTEKSLMIMKSIHDAKTLSFAKWIVCIVIMVLLFIYK